MLVLLLLFYFGSELTDFLLAASLSLDLEGFIINSIAVTKTISTSIDEVRRILLILDRLRLVLSTLITPGLNANVDSLCYGILSISSSSVIAGLSRCVFTLPAVSFRFTFEITALKQQQCTRPAFRKTSGLYLPMCLQLVHWQLLWC